MCGIVGYIDLREENRIDAHLLRKMTDTLIHRGPDSAGSFIDKNVAFGFRRLSIIDLESGDQPIYTEDRSVVTICNGEIFNYKELRNDLRSKGHSFRTNSDVEVLGHLYEDHGPGFIEKLNGQFAFAIYDRKERSLLLARDHFGINPLYYILTDGFFIFASEIKAVLEHPSVRREVNLTGLDQILSFPGLISPYTMFKDVMSLGSGQFLRVKDGDIQLREYWDLDYPTVDEAIEEKSEDYYIEKLGDLFARSVKYRLQADVPVGFYLSGGLDSSMIAGMIKKVSEGQSRHSFSITFTERQISEEKYQRLVSDYVGSEHHDIVFGWSEIIDRLNTMIYHCECPVKETYNTCSMALSEAARAAGITVILTGEGADELFAGYVGYRFDGFGIRNSSSKFNLETVFEEELREKLWGDKNLFYEQDHYTLHEIKSALYSPDVYESFEQFDCLNRSPVNKERLRNRHFIHQRSYLDFKLRLSDHLISDHGDRMSLANSIEARYPFLDVDLVDFAKKIPPHLKLNQFTEKYILRKVAAQGLVPPQILNREKYGFHAPGSPYLMKQNIEWINDLLSPARIERQGYFNPAVVERLKVQYLQEGFHLNLPFEQDLLTIVLTFGIFLDLFGLPSHN